MSTQNEVSNFRAEKNNFFRNHPQSPLHYRDQQQFSGLNYFPYDESFVYELDLQEYEQKEVVTMQTSDNQFRDYYQFGYFEFERDGDTHKLQVYQDLSNPDYYFLPFMDATTGKETYGAGRYLEIEDLQNGKFRVDFNKAYNPFCAYNENYSCPIPPRDNEVVVAIAAGEKNFKWLSITLKYNER